MRLFTVLLVLLLSLQSSALKAQQEIQLSQFMYQQLNYNPAYAGLQYGVNVQAVARFQWLGLSGAPMTQAVAADIPLPALNSGIGLHFSNDIIGAENNLKVSMDYAYIYRFSKYSSLSIGLSGGFFQKTLDGSALISPDGTYEPLVDHLDSHITNEFSSALIPNLSAGLYFQSGNLEFGLSAQQLLSNPSVLIYENGETSIRSQPHIYIYSAYKFGLGSNFTLNPSLLVKSDLVLVQSDIALKATYQDKYILGTGLRGYNSPSFDALVLLFGIKLFNHTTLSYSYDVLLSPLSGVSTGSHELSLSASLRDLLPRGGSKIIFNPRNL